MADHSQRDVFISHEKSDGDVALELAARLRAAGYSTWCYEEDSAAGGSYLVQIDRAIEAARSMVVIISPQSLRSPHVRNEIIRAYESEKRFIPIRRGMAHDDVMRAQDEEDDDRRREWRMAFGAAVSLPWDPGDPESVAARVADGLRRQGLLPGEPSGDYVAPPVRAQRPADRGATPQPSGATGGLRMPTDPAGLQELLRAPMTRVVAAGAIGAIGALVNAQNLLGVVAPGAEQWLYQLIPLMRLLNLAANGVGLWLNIRLVRMAWRLFQGDWTDEGAIRGIVALQLKVVAGWLGLALLLALVGVPSGAGTMRGPMISGVITAAVMAGAPLLLVRYLFQLRDRQAPGPAGV